MAVRKIALIGAGQIGSILALLSIERGLGDVVLFDKFGGVAKGKSLDLNQAATLLGRDFQVKGTDEYKDIEDADVCIVTAGFPRKPGMSRDDLLNKNYEVIKEVAIGVKKYAPGAFVIVVTNPLDIMVYSFFKHSGFCENKVVGMAGVLDSARFSTFVAWELGVSRKNVTSFVLGGHGDDMVPISRFSTVNGIPLTTLIEMGLLSQNKLDQIIERTKNGGGEIVSLLGNGSAFYSPAISALDMAESYLFNEKRLLLCANMLRGHYGVNGLFVGTPAIIGDKGVEKIIELQLNEKEKLAFEKSVSSVRKAVAEVELL